MKTIKITESLENMQKTVFSVNDIAKIIGKPKKYASLVLHRLKKRNLILEIERNKYVLKKTNPYVIFSNLVFPSYLSFLTAFSYYNLSTQIAKNILIATTKSKKEIKFENYNLKFIKLSKNRFFGYKREKTSLGFIFIAEIEKAIIDSLFLIRYCPIDETYNALSKEIKLIDIEKLIKYALKMKSKIVLKRLGYILEKKNINIYEKLKGKINNKYDPLNIGIKKGQKDKRWKLIINANLE